MRLQKFLARAGVASRRGAEELIGAGRVRVNGAAVAEMGTKVDPERDVVEVDGARVLPPAGERTVLMLHKPVGYVTTMRDAHARRIVADLVPSGRYPGLFPVGRLDRDTTGLLLFSTDGELGHALLHPRGHVTKRYVALVEGVVGRREAEALRRGVVLDDGPTLPAEVEVLSGRAADLAREALVLPEAQAKKMPREQARALRAGCGAGAGACSCVRLGIREGRNRQVRRMLACVGHPVLALHRESFGPLDLGSLPAGEWRVLDAAEVAALAKAAAGE